MAWRRANFRDQRVWAQVNVAGALEVAGGRVVIRYSDAVGAKLYRAGADRIALENSSAAVELPEGTDADVAPAAASARASGRGSGFGKAGTRSPAQARAAAAAAQGHLDGLADGTVRCFTDGACKGNPGPAGSGVLVELPDGRRIEASRALGRATNNVAELTALGMALDLLAELDVLPEAPAVLFTDSSYAEGVLVKGWKAKANTELILEIRRKIRARPGARLQWVAGHVGLEGNERADVLANRGVAGVTARSG